MDVKQLFQEYVLNTYTKVGPVFVRGNGSWLWDEDGKKYLDLFPGWGVSILGHCHPKLVKALREQLGALIHLPNNLYQAEQALLAKEIVTNCFPAKVFFGNSGAEGVEGALKISRLYGQKKGRYEIITMTNSFHGRTFGAMSATGQKKYKDPFKPILPGFKEAKFGDLTGLKKKITGKTVGVMLELIQGEGGINIADPAYIHNVKLLCQENDLLFIADEVQTGMGRTGELFCFQNYAITPDIMVLSKGLGAGIPVSAIVASNKLASLLHPGLHASTFGGSPLAARAARETFRIIKDDKLLANVKTSGNYLVSRLKELRKRFPVIKEVRGMGVMVGLELGCDGTPIVQTALKHGLIINCTHVNVLRIMPALNVTKAELDKGLDILEQSLVRVNH